MWVNCKFKSVYIRCANSPSFSFPSLIEMSAELTSGGGEREQGFTSQDKWQVLLSGLWKHLPIQMGLQPWSGVLHDLDPRASLACGAWRMGRTAWEGCSWNSCLAQFGCKSLIPQECPGFVLGRSCPTQGPGAAGGAALTEWDTGCACPREGCAWSPGQPGMSTEQPAQLPLLACLFPSRLHSAGFLWVFSLIMCFKHHLDLK